MKLRVVSYNVLSSHLASPSHFTTLNPEHLNAKNRLSMVLDKLEEQTKASHKSIICLQEVSYDWAGEFHTFFAKKGYHLVTGLYGRKFNGYMGVALAWPTDTFEATNVDISKLADKRLGGWPKPEEKTLLSGLWDTFNHWMDRPMRFLGLKSGEDPIDHWDKSQWRSNVLVSATLREKKSGQSFCIGTYHMPCAYYAPMIMTIHSEMAVRHVQDLAATDNLPYILAGDFNIKPVDSMYRLITSGKMDIGDPTYPTSKNGHEWKPTIDPMRSAYFVANGKEPDFTNFARVKEQDPFIDTLDYVFVSSSWKVEGVLTHPDRSKAGGPFPNLDKNEPSDHILIAADLSHS